ncbi:Ig-like domain repeat protein [Vulcanisaeta souniana]|uniref:Ig-like domain repeat protein n=1 Tax=Vulcanisaeta souniana TaxID=164452 RepID=UPI000B29D2FF|nr:Ig-like domain repeat protein [Vulcanisaeta souniana]
MMITLLIMHTILMMLADPPTPFTVTSATWYYGTYPETISNNTQIYTGVGINSTISIDINNNLPTPINITYALSIGRKSTQGIVELQPGNNTLSITAPGLGQGNYNATLVLGSLGYSVSYYFTVYSVIPSISISAVSSTLYSGVPQIVTIRVVSTSPIPITSALIAVSGTNATVSTGVFTIKPPSNTSVTVTPGPYTLNTAALSFRISYTDAGGYSWTANETLTFTVIPTPVTIVLSAQSNKVNYGNYLPISIQVSTPVGPLQNQQLSVYVDNNYVTTVTTNSQGTTQYILPVNYGIGYHTLTVLFTNTTYFQEASANYTFFVLPGTVYIIAYVNNTNITYGNAVSIYVKLSPPISGGTLTISYVINGSSSVIGSYTPVNGSVNATWIPPQASTYLILIYYVNSPNYLPSSTNLTLTVKKAPCSLSIAVNGTPPEVLHEITVISYMNPAIINTQLNIQVTPSSGIPMSGAIYVNTSGMSEYTFTPETPGNYTITVSWPGNINYQSCSATKSLSIGRASLSLSVNESNNLIAAGGHVLFSISLTTDIPINYVNGNITITISSSNKTISTYEIPITGNYIRGSIPFNAPGNYRVLIYYPGNEYVKPSTYGPTT